MPRTVTVPEAPALQTRHATVLVALVLAATPLAAALVAASPFLPPVASADDAAAVEHVTIPSFDGTRIAATVFKPVGASADAPVPIVLNSHGWGGARVKSPTGTVGALVDAGYGVLTFDARGHGGSGSVATVHHRDHEVKDFTVILDWIHENLEWVRKSTEDGPRDLVAGAFGYSYAGGFQTQTASHDGRLDAIVPEMTWHDLRYSLAPDRVPKSVWVDLLYWSAKAGGTRVSEDIDRWYYDAMTENTIPEDALDHFRASSPTFEKAGNVNVLVIQGIPDVLFNLNEGIANYLAFEAASTGDVRLSTHLTGHVIPGVQPLGLDPYRTDQAASRHPCGDMRAQTLAWFHEHLRGNTGAADFVPEVAYALENGECVELDALNTATTSARFDALVAPQGAGSVLVPVLEGPALVAGIPRVTARPLGVTGGILHFALVVAGPTGGLHVVDDQSTAVRYEGSAFEQELEADLAGVATRLGAGDTLFLRIDGVNEWFAHNGARTPGAVVLENVTVTLPLA